MSTPTSRSRTVARELRNWDDVPTGFRLSVLNEAADILCAQADELDMMASEASGLRGIPRVTLQPESDALNIDQRHHVIACVRETGDAWEGYLVSATDGRAVEPPVFGVWPKSAWKAAEKTT